MSFRTLKTKVARKIIDISAKRIEAGGLSYLKDLNPSTLGYVFGWLFSFTLPQKKHENARNVLCFDRFVFARDLKVLHEKGENNYISFQSGLLGSVFSLYVPRWMKVQVLSHQYVQERPDLLKKMLDFSEGFLSAIQKKIRIDVILLAGIDYFSDYSFHIVARKNSIPLMALFYEHYTIPYIQKSNTHLYKDFDFHFTGDALACFGEKTAKVFRESGVIDEDKLFVTGAPRYDVWRAEPDPSQKLDTMLLFSYPGIEYGAPLNFNYTLIEFARSSSKHHHLRYVVKCKDKNHADQVLDHVKGLNHNITIAVNEPIEDLLNRARAIFSFNSLTCIEALLSRAHVYIPHFADACLPDDFLQITPHSLKDNVDGFIFLETPQAFLAALDKEATASTSDYKCTNDRIALFGEYFHYDLNQTSVHSLDLLVRRVLL